MSAGALYSLAYWYLEKPDYAKVEMEEEEKWKSIPYHVPACSTIIVITCKVTRAA